MSDPADQQRLIGDLIRLGTVESVDLAQSTCRVKTGDLVTGDIPWLTSRAGGTKHWSPLTVGEQCVLLCPEGDTLGGLVLPGLFSDANAAPSAEDLDLIAFADGARISYDATAHLLKAELPDGATAEITAPGGVTITGDVTITGKLSVSETIDADDEITGNGIKLSKHHHKDTQPGAGMTGAPV